MLQYIVNAAEGICAGRVSDLAEAGQKSRGGGNRCQAVYCQAELSQEGTSQKGGTDVVGIT